MENLLNEQPAESAVAPSESAAQADGPDSAQDAGGAGSGQPSGKKWAKLFDSPEKLEDAYGHIYRAYHAKCRELQQTGQALEGMVQLLGQGSGPRRAAPPAPGVFPGLPGGFRPGAQPAGPGEAEFALLHAVAQAQAEAQHARQMGERFLTTSLENQVRDFFKEHSELGEGEEDFGRFAREVSISLGTVDADALHRLPEAIDRAYRVVNYPEAVRDARRQQEREEKEAERYVVEGGGSGSMSVPRNQARETSFRALVQRLKREAGLA